MKHEDDDECEKKIAKAFKKFPYFNGWTDSSLSDLHKNSLIKCFHREDIILGFGEGCLDHVYFVLRGECSALQVLISRQHAPHTSCPASQCANVVQLCIFLPGATFNVGEPMGGRCVIARSLSVWCLLAPRYLLLCHGNTDNVWTRLRLFLEERLPSDKRLRQLLSRQHSWHSHCAKLTRA